MKIKCKKTVCMKRWTLLTWARAWHARVTPLHWKRSGSKRTFLQNKISNENVWFHTYILIITCCCCCFFLMDSIVRITFGTKRCCSCYILKKKNPLFCNNGLPGYVSLTYVVLHHSSRARGQSRIPALNRQRTSGFAANWSRKPH